LALSVATDIPAHMNAGVRIVPILFLLNSCGGAPMVSSSTPVPAAATKPAASLAFTLSIVGTNDLHGALERLPILGGYVNNLRNARATDGGAVLMVDAGDMFQGTFESNFAEGADVVTAYNQLGYAAAAVGNHEFDFGPAGPAATANSVQDDARGALKARAAEAKFPFLTANILDQESADRIKWPNMPASTLVTVQPAGGVTAIKVGIVGVTTEATPLTTMPANFIGLKMASPAATIAGEAKRLREQGAVVVIAAMHIGSKCKDLHDPNDVTSCDTSEELFKVLSDIPKGLIDVVVAGHTHAAMAHRINDVAVIESFSSGRAFGRVDLRINPQGNVVAAKIFPPQDLCGRGTSGNALPIAQCAPVPYEGAAVVPDVAVQAIVDRAIARTGTARNEPLGVTVTSPIWKAYDKESPLGNLFADLLLASQPTADIAMTNGGGLRADLPAGSLTFGQLFEAMPFDNRFALVDIPGVHLRKLIARNLGNDSAMFSWAGLNATANCTANALRLDIRVKGKPLSDSKMYKVVTSDFLASGGDGVIGRMKLPSGSVTVTDQIIRDGYASILRSRKGTLDPNVLFNTKNARIAYTGTRPITCGAASAVKSADVPD
jgi:2',3'-cyclic-nucleotide 2'-phosphodiesterase (5'-nucleotidase family)